MVFVRKIKKVENGLEVYRFQGVIVYLEIIVMMMMCLKRCDKIMLLHGRRINIIYIISMNMLVG